MYRAVFISDPSWEEPSPAFASQDEAGKWPNRQIMYGGKPRDRGYVVPALEPAAA